jgi:tRNA pseudouridine32 synthase/23S rRNA pseudouridine746 synthase
MSEYVTKGESCFTLFRESIDSFDLPERFNYPFYYDPSPIALQAATELQEYLKIQEDWEHNFGIEEGKEGLVIGKMFGVLVVENKEGQIGYISAFSGKLAGQNHHSRFVPPVFDILTEDGLYKTGEKIINVINAKIEALEQDPEFLSLKSQLESETELVELKLQEIKKKNKVAKQLRDQRRKEAFGTLSQEEYDALLVELGKESVYNQYYLKDVARILNQELETIRQKIDRHTTALEELKEERRIKSSALQRKIFDQYSFLNQNGETKSLLRIFEHTTDVNPPAGAGECAAPKLLQYAFLHQMKPIALAEFWWGQSPDADIKKHGNFYPACRGKCEPILGHMLVGMDVEENPMLTNPAIGKELKTVFEDEHLLIVNKPAEFLSVPGINIVDSVYERIRLKYPNATGPLVVHRLDMSTSGLLLIAKSLETHKILQRQFINRKVKKQYVAVLDGVVSGDEGTIDLPLRLDIDDRPHQMVCYEHGKNAVTHWKVLERTETTTRIQFFPITGRTHQLRVHAAHSLGLNAPIHGDDLYGKKADRLFLHAETLEFYHPVSKEIMSIQVDPEF